MDSMSAFAVLPLMLSSNFLGCSMGSSLGFAPLQELGDLVGREIVDLRDRDAVACEATGVYHVAKLADSRKLRRQAQLPEALAEARQHCRRDDIHSLGTSRPESSKRRLQVVGPSNVDHLKGDPHSPGRFRHALRALRPACRRVVEDSKTLGTRKELFQ